MAKPTKETIRNIAASHGISQAIADQVSEIIKPHLDDTTAPVIGGNAEAALTDMVARINTQLDEIAEHDAIISEIYTTAKEEGWDVAVLKQVVKESRADPERMVNQLTREKVLTTYRKAAGISTDLAEAQRLARAAADVAEPAKKRRSKADD